MIQVGNLSFAGTQLKKAGSFQSVERELVQLPTEPKLDSFTKAPIHFSGRGAEEAALADPSVSTGRTTTRMHRGLLTHFELAKITDFFDTHPDLRDWVLPTKNEESGTGNLMVTAREPLVVSDHDQRTLHRPKQMIVTEKTSKMRRGVDEAFVEKRRSYRESAFDLMKNRQFEVQLKIPLRGSHLDSRAHVEILLHALPVDRNSFTIKVILPRIHDSINERAKVQLIQGDEVCDQGYLRAASRLKEAILPPILDAHETIYQHSLAASLVEEFEHPTSPSKPITGEQALLQRLLARIPHPHLLRHLLHGSRARDFQPAFR